MKGSKKQKRKITERRVKEWVVTTDAKWGQATVLSNALYEKQFRGKAAHFSRVRSIISAPRRDPVFWTLTLGES